MSQKEPDLFISTSSLDREVVAWLNELFRDAAERKVNDIHLQERDGKLRVRFRLPGGLQDVFEIPNPSYIRMVDEKIRSRAQLPTSDRRSALDGRIQLRFKETFGDEHSESDRNDVYRKLDIRISITPNNGGQLTVCRLLDQSNTILSLDKIEMTQAVRFWIDSLIAEPSGLFLVTGPTGSGKTTTLYSIINELNTPDRNIITIEDPVEYCLDGISQIGVSEHITFAQALRAVLRQDPDVILVGEIRDSETAKIAVAAAMTGHLVLATLHANNSIQAITRLLDLGVDINTLAPALRGVTAQRLVRRIAGHIEMIPPSDMERSWLSGHNLDYPNLTFPSASDSTQYAGYIPVIEMLVFDEEMRKAMPGGEAAMAAVAANQVQYETLAQSGVRMAAAGKTTLSEVRHIAGTISADAAVKGIGQILVESGVITMDQRDAAVNEQISLMRHGVHKRLGDLLVEMGFCSPEDLSRCISDMKGSLA